MTMLIELDSDNRASLRRLFDRYPCLHGSVAAVIEGGMGRVFADAQEEPCVALAVLDFHFLAGDPLHANALRLFKLLQPGNVVIAPTPSVAAPACCNLSPSALGRVSSRSLSGRTVRISIS